MGNVGRTWTWGGSQMTFQDRGGFLQPLSPNSRELLQEKGTQSQKLGEQAICWRHLLQGLFLLDFLPFSKFWWQGLKFQLFLGKKKNSQSVIQTWGDAKSSSEFFQVLYWTKCLNKQNVCMLEILKHYFPECPSKIIPIGLKEGDKIKSCFEDERSRAYLHGRGNYRKMERKETKCCFYRGDWWILLPSTLICI